MKKLQLLAGIAFVLALIGVGGAKLVSASSFHTGNNVTTASSQVVNDTVYAAGKTVDISSTVNGDVFCAGQDITISGTVHGDVICAGQTVNVSGTVDGNVRLAGQTVNLSAKVSGNATIGGQTFAMDSASTVGGDMTIGSTTATLNGTIGRDLVTGGNSTIIGGLVGRDVNAGVTTLQLSSGARVGGNIALTSKNNLVKDSGATVLGKVTHTVPQNQTKSKHWALFGFGVAWFIYCLFALLLTAIVLTLLFPRLLVATTNRALPHPWKALLVGFVACLAAPVVLVVLAATVVGIPLAVLLGLSWLVVLLLSGPVFGFYIGRLVLPDSSSVLLTMLVGALLLTILYFVPIVGFLAMLAAVWIGSGMVLLEAFSRTPRPVYTSTPPAKKK